MRFFFFFPFNLAFISAFLLHRSRADTYRVQLLVQAARVADVAPVGVLPPQGRLGGQTVGTKDAAASSPLRVKRNRAIDVTFYREDGKKNQNR